MDDIPEAKRFEKPSPVHVQAQQIWLILVSWVMNAIKAGNRRFTVPYGEVAKAMGYSRVAAINIRRPLGAIGYFCKLNGLPTLNSVVVSAERGEPGEGVVTRKGRTWREEQADVMKQDWFDIRVPTTGAFRKAWELANKA